jgi:hypothetical protein
VDPASDADGEGGYVIGEEVAKRKMISQSSGGSLPVGVSWWLTAGFVDSVVVVVSSINIMVFLCMEFRYNDEK